MFGEYRLGLIKPDDRIAFRGDSPPRTARGSAEHNWYESGRGQSRPYAVKYETAKQITILPSTRRRGKG